MGNFTVSLKKLTEKVSMDVVYTPQDLERNWIRSVWRSPK